jgi:CubicO group peptidase (beta-lactamase class C family)
MRWAEPPATEEADMYGEETGGLSAERLAQIAPMLQAEVDRGLLAGAATLVWRKGTLVHAAAVGWRDLAAKAPMTPDTLCRIASMTKPIVSLATLMLLEEGRLRLDDPVTRWLPELADMRVLNDPGGALDDTRPAARDITIDDLLTHRSGLVAGYTIAGPIAQAYNERLASWLAGPVTPDAWLAALGQLPLAFPPGERFHYGVSIDVLGFLVARIEGRPLGEVLRRRILDPLGMADTLFWPPPDRREQMSRMYRIPPQPGPLLDVSFPLPAEAPAFESGSGGLISTAHDYLKFARLMLGGGEMDGVRLARPETIALMTTNRLTPAQRAIPFLGVADWWASQGFGLGVSMVLDAPRHPAASSPGAFTWPGAFGTWWLADPAEEMILVYMIQDSVALSPETLSQVATGERPGGRSAQVAFQNLVYAALER